MKQVAILLVAVSLLAMPFLLKAQGGEMAIVYNGEEDFVGFSSLDFGLRGELTVCAWIRWDTDPRDHGSTPKGQRSTIISNNSSSEREDGQFWLQHDRFNKHFEFAVNANGYDWVNSHTIPDSGEWYHVAGVYNGGLPSDERLKIYINGIYDTQEKSVCAFGNITPYSNEYDCKTGRWSYAYGDKSFSGVIDEVCVWSKALSEEEIRHSMCEKRSSFPRTLAAYWRFDCGDGDSVVDYTGNAHLGIIFSETGKPERCSQLTLTDCDKNWKPGQWINHRIIITEGMGKGQQRSISGNTAMTITVSEVWEQMPNANSKYAISTTYNWIPSSAPIGDESIFLYNTDWLGDSIMLYHSDGDGMKINEISGNPSGIHLYRVDAPPNMSEPPHGWIKLDPLRYWGVFAFGGSNPTFSLTYNYDGHPGIFVERDLGLAKRENAEAEVWINTEAILDTRLNTLLLESTDGTEYILMDRNGENPLPIMLDNFVAEPSCGFVRLQWETKGEVSNMIYKILKSASSNGDFACIATVPGNGPSAAPIRYRILDSKVMPGSTYWYRLLAEADGEIWALGPILAHCPEAEWGISLCSYPNPFSKGTEINIHISRSGSDLLFHSSAFWLRIYDISGRLVWKTRVASKRISDGFSVPWIGEDSQGNKVPNGVYFCALTKDGKRIAGSRLQIVR
jgi:hypothetical protein